MGQRLAVNLTFHLLRLQHHQHQHPTSSSLLSIPTTTTTTTITPSIPPSIYLATNPSPILSIVLLLSTQIPPTKSKSWPAGDRLDIYTQPLGLCFRKPEGNSQHYLSYPPSSSPSLLLLSILSYHLDNTVLYCPRSLDLLRGPRQRTIYKSKHKHKHKLNLNLKKHTLRPSTLVRPGVARSLARCD